MFRSLGVLALAVASARVAGLSMQAKHSFGDIRGDDEQGVLPTGRDLTFAANEPDEPTPQPMGFGPAAPPPPKADCWLGEEHVAHVSDVDACMNVTQRAREVYLSEGAKAMRSYVESGYIYEDGIHDKEHVQLPYAFVFLYPADLSISVDAFTQTTVRFMHPFFHLGELNATFSAGSSHYNWYELALHNAQAKPNGYVWTSHSEFHSVKSQLVDGYHIETEETHRKDYIQVLVDGIDGSEYAGRRFSVGCGYVELGHLGPTAS